MIEQSITNIPVENPQQKQKKRNKTQIFSLIAIISLCVFVTLSFLLSSAVDNYYDGNTATLFLFCFAQLGLFIPMLVIFFAKHKKFNVAQIVLFSIFIAVTILNIVLSILTYYNSYETYYNYYYSENYYYYYTAVECWVIFAFNIASLILATLTYIFNLIVFARERKQNKSTNSVNNVNTINNSKTTAIVNNQTFDTTSMVKELTEVKTVYDQKLITEEEYNNIRASIIAKYYKQ